MRVYRPDASIGATITLSDEQKRHARALRVQPEDPIFVFDGKGKEYRAEHIEKVRGAYKCTEEIPPRLVPGHLTLAIACAKGNRMDTLVEKATELGVKEIIPTSFARSIVKPRAGKIARWRTLSIEACAQSGRADLPKIHELTPYAEVLEKVRDHDAAYLCVPHGKRGDLSQDSILFIVGPEGGFTDDEEHQALAQGCTSLQLSPTILRIETAGIAALAQAVGQRPT